MLINLSNHPSSSWNEKQKKEALKYGNILDIPFPDISPDIGTEDVEKSAQSYFKLCKDTASPDKATIHIAGEPVFCFLLIQLLLKENYTCIVSTTERIVREENNEKISVFEFNRFRKYKLL